MAIQENTNRSLFVPQTSRNGGVRVLLDYSVGTGDLTGLCQAGSVIGFWVPTAHHPFPRILTLFAFVSAMSNVPPFLLWLLHVSRRKAWEWPLAHMAGHPPQEDLLALCPLTLGWWLYHLPAAREFSSLPLSMGWGRGTTSLAPHLYLEAKAVLRRGTVFFICMQVAQRRR